MDTENHPVPVRPEEFGQSARLLFVVRKPLEKAVLVNLPDKERAPGYGVVSVVEEVRGRWGPQARVRKPGVARRWST